MSLRPNLTPRAFARSRPSLVLAKMRCLSNSANPPSTVIISLPCGVVVSAQELPRDLKPAPRSPIAARVLSRSLVLRARRSSLVTSNTSPSSRTATALAKALRSVTAPLTFSAKTCSAIVSARLIGAPSACVLTLRLILRYPKGTPQPGRSKSGSLAIFAALLKLIIDVRDVAVLVPHDEAGLVIVIDGPGRREAASGGHLKKRRSRIIESYKVTIEPTPI